MPRARPPAPANPFIIGHHAEGAAFADREAEVAQIARAFGDPSSRLVVYGERRLGKSSAVRVAAAQARAAGHPVAVVDLAAATTAAAAAQRVLAAVHDEIGQRWRDIVTNIVARLRGAVTITPSIDAQGTASLAFTIDTTLRPIDLGFFTETLDAVEAELAARRRTLGLALDEFQRLQALTGTALDWPLKELLERHRRIAYVLAGSERAIVQQMLHNKKAGLWKVVDVLDIHPIAPAVLADWLRAQAAATHVAVAPAAAALIVRLGGPRTRDVVQLARAVWDLTHDRGRTTPADIAAAMDLLVREQAALHQRAWRSYTDLERRILLVVAADPSVQLTAAHTLQARQLGPKTSVARAVKQLIQQEILLDDEAPGHRFDDPYFRRWIELTVFADLGRPVPPLGPTEAPG